MGEAYFYHLTRNAVDVTLATLLNRSLAQAWRVVVRGGDAGRLEWLDERLWQGDGFLPHGLAGGPHDARQPILLTTGAGESRDCLMAVDGAEVAPDEVATMKRTCILFDGTDGDAVSRARVQWKALTDAGCAARYWSEESGKWEEKASKNVAE
ncbi:DNA polymerase III, chi subunit [Jannaschia faecimaris]|uniref:DNA polymerase III, chi subunit n=1 Tax=Jannaschia faecimaris TaxID=1244108 RepID=A0A1H3QHF4_9RHOB|nr:DNA polymerase III subunit chi [Jannaschia faecimaris]SDZ12952.1 DNA polymerase III, chi subunit [Jannaschia faecimaris]